MRRFASRLSDDPRILTFVFEHRGREEQLFEFLLDARGNVIDIVEMTGSWCAVWDGNETVVPFTPLRMDLVILLNREGANDAAPQQ